MTQEIGDRFQEETKYRRDRMPAGGPDWGAKPGLYKEYPAVNKIDLPKPGAQADVSLHDAIGERRSVRSFADVPLATDQLSYLLWASTGIQRRQQGYEFRTAPSAGALYPIETYVVVNNVTSLAHGIYHYSIRDHRLEELETGEFGPAVARSALDQDMCAEAPAVFVWTAIPQRMKWKYRQRAYRYIYMDAGHIAENLALAAVALGLGTCQIGAIYDEEANEIVGTDGTNETVVYMSVVGVPE